jgi:hypothetical protein
MLTLLCCPHFASLCPCVCLLSTGGSIEDVPRGTTAGEILREKGVFAIMDATAGTTSSSSSSSDSDADPVPEGLLVPDGSAVDGRARLQAQRQQAGAPAGACAGGGAQQQQQQQQQLVNVNNRLVSEDTVLQDGDLVILAREKIKI